MARPRKQGLDYFPFDCDFFSHEKVVAIAGEFGLKGEIIIVKLLCAVYRNGYFVEWSDMMKYKFLKDLPGVSSELLDQVINRLVKWEFFDKGLFDSDRILTSAGIQNRYFEATKRRGIGDETPYILSYCNKNYTSREVSVTKTNVIVNKNPLNKIKGNIIDDVDDNAREKIFDFVKNEKTKIEKESSGGAVAVADVAPAPATSAAPVQVQRGVYGVARCKPVADLVAECKASTEWVESVCMSTGLSQADVLTRLDGFPAHLTANGYDGDKSMDDFKRHFFNFVKKQQANGNHQQAATGRASGLCTADGRYYAKPNPDDIYAEHRRRYGLQ